MKRIFVSLPGREVPMPELLNQHHILYQEAIHEVMAINSNEEVEVISRLLVPLSIINGENPWVYFLGDTIMKLAFADYAFFAWNWETSKECRFEHAIAKEYGIKILYQNKPTEVNT